MQLQQMKQLGEQMQAQNNNHNNMSILGDISVFDQGKAIGLQKSRQKNTFFGAMSKKMGEVFNSRVS